MHNKRKFFSLLKKIDCSGRTQPERYLRPYYKKLNHCIGQILPSKLYRFRSTSEERYNQEIENLKNDQFYLRSPKTMNDPTDCLYYINPEKVIGKLAPYVSDYNNITPEEYDSMCHRMSTIDNVLNSFNYAFEKVKIASFTEDILSPLMWSHYAYEHKGFALRYDMNHFDCDNCKKCNCFDICYRPQYPFYPVIYTTKRADTTSFAIEKELNGESNKEDNFQIPFLPLLQKSKEWKYEKEWRCICRNPDKKCFHFKPDAIYLGNRMDENKRKELADIALRKNMEVYDISINFDNPYFQMEAWDYSEDGTMVYIYRRK